MNLLYLEKKKCILYIMGKLSELISKDTNNKNETKRMTVLIRKLCLSFLLLSVFNLPINALLLHSFLGSMIWVGMIVVDILTLYISYNSSKRTLLRVFIIQKILWITASVLIYGWEGGFQFFLILLIILYSFGEAGYNNKKLIFNFICFVLFIFFFLFYKGKNGTVNIDGIERIIAVFSTLLFCTDVAFVATSFSQESQENEEKIVQYNKQLEREAGEDALTGLKNRRSTSEFIRSLVKNQATFSICICDIDYFKKVNDTYGHEFGDDVLVAISDILKKKEGVFASRWGGEEFLLVFPGLNGDEAYLKVNEIRNEVKALVVPHGENNISVTMTYGVTEYALTNPLEENIKEVDEKLYMGKQSGRDRIVY